MEDEKILELYFARNEEAIRQTDRSYGKRLHSVAFHVLRNQQDAEESVNDTYEYYYDASVDFTRYDMPMYVVMKDGTRIPFVGSGGGIGKTWYIMESHVNVDEVDYVVLMDGTKMEVSQ